MSNDVIQVYCDGGSRGNPGPSAAGVVFLTTSGEVTDEFNKFLGEQTNNFAEYSAVILALEKLHEKKITQADMFLDSELVTKQLNGEYKVKNANIKPLYEKVVLMRRGIQLKITHVLRAKNKLADEQVNICLDNYT